MPTTDLSIHDTFPKLLLHHAQQRGARPAIREKRRGIWQTVSWSAYADEVRALAAALDASGLRAGGHVVLIGDNRPRLYAAMCAAQWLGAAAVPLSQDATAAELAYPLAVTGATHVFAEDQEQVDKVLELLPGLPALTTVIYDNDRGMRHYAQPQLQPYASFIEQGRQHLAGSASSIDVEMLRRSGAEAALVFFTADDAGRSRGVVLSHAALIDRARVAAQAAALTDADTALAYLPPAWIGQTMFSFVQPMVVGYCVACPESSETMLADLREIGPTYLFAPPRVLKTLVSEVTARMEDAGAMKRRLYANALAQARHSAQDGGASDAGGGLGRWMHDLLIHGPLRDVLGMSRLRVAYTSSEALGGELVKFFRAIGVNLKQLYGSAETGLFVCAHADGQVRAGTVGAALPGVTLRLGARDEVLVRTSGLFEGYLGDAEASLAAVDADGWFRTGDAGHLDADGQLRIIDRIGALGALTDGAVFAPNALAGRLEASPFVKAAVAVGAGRDRVCAILHVDATAMADWANRRGLSHTGHADLAARPEVAAMLSDWVAQVNAGLAGDPVLAGAQVHRFVVLPEDAGGDAAPGERAASADRYRAVVDAMYAGARSVRAAALDGHLGTASADLSIHDVRTGPATGRPGPKPTPETPEPLLEQAA